MNPVLEKTEVIEKIEISPGLFIVKLESEKISKSAQPGQFVEVDPGGEFFLRRPFSIMNAYWGTIELLIKIVGDGTRSLLELKTPWDLIGPLGNTFTVEADTTPVLAGGGVGAAPLKFFAERLYNDGRNFEFYLGARTAKEIPLEKSDKLAEIINFATDDGSEGFHGTVVQSLEDALGFVENPFIYACGPKPMLAALREFMLENEIDGDFSLENRMACGIGVCQGCAVPVEDGFKLVCKDGPVFPFDYIDESYWKK